MIKLQQEKEAVICLFEKNKEKRLENMQEKRIHPVL